MLRLNSTILFCCCLLILRFYLLSHSVTCFKIWFCQFITFIFFFSSVNLKITMIYTFIILLSYISGLSCSCCFVVNYFSHLAVKCNKICLLAKFKTVLIAFRKCDNRIASFLDVLLVNAFISGYNFGTKILPISNSVIP